MPESISDSNSERPGTASGDTNEPGGDATERAGMSLPADRDKPAGKAGHGHRRLKFAGLLSTAFWTIGLILPFVLPSTSPYVWVSDCFLLIGFWPLLFIWPAGWPWIVFGVMNIAIGFFLEFNKVIPYYLDDSFWTPDRIAMKPLFMQTQKHVADMHPMMPWLLIGFASTIYGAVRAVKTIIRWTIKLIKRSP